MEADPAGLLVDTQLLVWWATTPEQLKPTTRELLASSYPPVLFSVVSLWEVAIKASLKRLNFQIDPGGLRAGLLEEGFTELPIQSDHVLAVEHLPLIHRDPHRCAEDGVFDRLLVVQAAREGLRLLTSNRTLASYGDPVHWVAG